MLKNDNRFFLSRLIFYVGGLSFYIVQPMDQAIMSKKQDIAWGVFFTHNREGLPYNDEHSFAQTNRGNCTLIYRIQDYRKNDIYNCMMKKNIVVSSHAYYVWHRSWRICGLVDIITHKEDATLSSSCALRMFSCELNANQPPICKSAIWDNFNAELPHKPLPFFNKNKELCFHGFQKNVYVDHGPTNNSMMFQGVMEYTTHDSFACELLIPRGGQYLEPQRIRLVEFLRFPVLLQNVLASDKAIIDLVRNKPFPQYKSYSIDVLQLSDNYKEFQEVPYACISVASFNDVSETIRNALARRYKEQKAKSA